MTDRRITTAVLGLALVASLTACGSEGLASDMKAMDVVEALDVAGLEAEDPTDMGPSDFGPAPYVTEDAVRFLVPSLGEDSGGRVFTLDNLDDLHKLEDHYVSLGEGSAWLFSWVWTNEEKGVLVQMNGTMDEGLAGEYQEVIEGL